MSMTYDLRYRLARACMIGIALSFIIVAIRLGVGL